MFRKAIKKESSERVSTAAVEVGEILRRAREERGFTIEDMANQTRIRIYYLQALEDGAIDKLPGLTFAIGYLKLYVQCLDLPEKELVQKFGAGLDKFQNTLATEIFQPPSTAKNQPGKKLVIGGILLLGVLIVFYDRYNSDIRTVLFTPSVSVENDSEKSEVKPPVSIVKKTTPDPKSVDTLGEATSINDFANQPYSLADAEKSKRFVPEQHPFSVPVEPVAHSEKPSNKKVETKPVEAEVKSVIVAEKKPVVAEVKTEPPLAEKLNKKVEIKPIEAEVKPVIVAEKKPVVAEVKTEPPLAEKLNKKVEIKPVEAEVKPVIVAEKKPIVTEVKTEPPLVEKKKSFDVVKESKQDVVQERLPKPAVEEPVLSISSLPVVQKSAGTVTLPRPKSISERYPEPGGFKPPRAVGPKTVTLDASERIWVQIFNSRGEVLKDMVMNAGDHFVLPEGKSFFANLSSAGGVRFWVGEKQLPKMGQTDELMQKIDLSPEALLALRPH
ncbi:MAG: DUF4115 domain-containing protein [Magnetococcus sp. DMHC-6]